MKKYLWLVAFLTIFFTSFRNANQDKCSVRLEYSGDASKPFPIIIFYTSGSIDTTHANNSADTTIEMFFARRIEISESEFNDVNKSIKNIAFISSPPVLRDSFAITIQKNNQKKIYFSSSVSEINQTFDSVITQLKGHKNIIIIERYIDQFKRRLGIVQQ